MADRGQRAVEGPVVLVGLWSFGAHGRPGDCKWYKTDAKHDYKLRFDISNPGGFRKPFSCPER